MHVDDGYVSLVNLKGGAAVEAVDFALGEVFENILDPNTDPKATRKVVMELVFKPNPDREAAGCEIKVKPILAPQAAMTSTVYVAKDDDGRAVGAEFGPRDPRQHTLPGTYDDGKVTPIKKAAEA